MMDYSTWHDGLLEIVAELASRPYQERVWMHGDNQTVSSWEEAVCGFFDDFDAEGFVDTYLRDERDFGQKRKSLVQLCEVLSNYARAKGNNPDPEEIIDDPKWEEVRRSARWVLSAWEHPERD